MDKKLNLFGYCSFSQQRLEDLFLTKREELIAQAKGNFVVVWDDNYRVVIVTSDIGIIPYYYYYDGNKFIHGKKLLEVFKACNIQWEWDFQALADYIVYNHIIDSSTFHKKIKKTTINTILYFSNKSIKEKPLTKIALNKDRKISSPNHTLEILKSESEIWFTQLNPTLSLTGGFDSRLLLALMLSLGIKPDLIVSGQRGSFDLEVVKNISKTFGLSFTITEVTASDFIEYANKTVEATGGMLPMSHWAGHLWAASYNKNSPILVGFNGEFARTYYFDKGIFSYLINYLSPGSIYKYSLLKTKINPELRSLVEHLHPSLQEEFSNFAEKFRFERMLSFSDSNILDKLDSFFITSYTRNKTGMDISALENHVSWFAPFCSILWVKSVQNLPRSWKLGSRFHRFAIKELCPKLLSFPEEGKGDEMLLNPNFLYWAKKKAVVPFFNDKHLEDIQVQELMQKGIRNLEDILSAEAINLLLKAESIQTKILAYQLAPVGLFMSLLRTGV